MANPYDIHEGAQAPRPAQSTDARGGVVRPVLWVVLVVSAATNIVTTPAGLSVLVGIGSGLLTLACGTALVIDHRAHRSR
jgi:hypothetical protein